ncbi:hypothetical protein KFK09_004534 [Dendrobium nobile]|uniref:Uncharacterized protein n=1 Tax=Dendrobium nobile TaxID=94219 RepID=A0A8T3C0M0_DENNO|nr:hypothetical protein KFK09_004534 [Dendrobium nobile]
MEQIVDVDNEISLDGEEKNGVGAADWAFPSLRRLCLRDLRCLRVFGVDACYGLPGDKGTAFWKEMAVRKLKEIWVTPHSFRHHHERIGSVEHLIFIVQVLGGTAASIATNAGDLSLPVYTLSVYIATYKRFMAPPHLVGSP